MCFLRAPDVFWLGRIQYFMLHPVLGLRFYTYPFTSLQKIQINKNPPASPCTSDGKNCGIFFVYGPHFSGFWCIFILSKTDRITTLLMTFATEIKQYFLLLAIKSKNQTSKYRYLLCIRSTFSSRYLL